MPRYFSKKEGRKQPKGTPLQTKEHRKTLHLEKENTPEKTFTREGEGGLRRFA